MPLPLHARSASRLGVVARPSAGLVRQVHACCPWICSPQIVAMLEAFKEGRVMHMKYAWALVNQTKELLAKEETLQVGVPGSRRGRHETIGAFA